MFKINSKENKTKIQILTDNLKEFEKKYKKEYYYWNIIQMSYIDINKNTIYCHWNPEEIGKWKITLEKSETKF